MLNAATITEPLFHFGMCDASAAVALDGQHFAVANDEDNPIRAYRADEGSLPVQTFDFSKDFRVDPKKPEMDLEGACWLGEKIFWISSHGRNKDGEVRPSRQILFATTGTKTARGFEMKPVGKPYRLLLADLIREPRFASLHLAEASRLAPKVAGALNIEGLCATPEGKLLIGFRNPVPQSQALLIPLENPEQVITGQRGKFGEPILLALDGLGVRDIAFWQNQYLIIGGATDGKPQSSLFVWDGKGQPKKVDWLKLANFNPEALIVYEGRTNAFQVLSDDGTRRIGTEPCKNLKDPKQRRFRSVWVQPSE
jgi:Protein of unknown function (DUF3616)